jgi:hypothetical protein
VEKLLQEQARIYVSEMKWHSLIHLSSTFQVPLRELLEQSKDCILKNVDLQGALNSLIGNFEWSYLSSDVICAFNNHALVVPLEITELAESFPEIYDSKLPSSFVPFYFQAQKRADAR